ncbi:hypothetical protein CRENBAI_018128 [Crenichthys baileyi]|uniref:Uncharacterized protein n=1 Tax=Crenichthys baileyi TaxID=28760 RepID=A0AAV9SDW7_9TELE
MHRKEAALPPEMQKHQHPCQPSRNDRVKPSCGSPRANATATPHILPYIGRGTVKTTNPEHTPPTRNHPADKQTPPQHEAEKPDATAEPSDAHPAIQNTEASAAMHRTTTPTLQHAKQRRTVCSNEHPKQKPSTKPTPCKYAPHRPSKNKAPCKRAPPSHARKPTPKRTKDREPTEPKPKPTKKPRPVHAEINPDQPARPPKPCRPLRPPSSRQNRDQHQELESRQGTRI